MVLGGGMTLAGGCWAARDARLRGRIMGERRGKVKRLAPRAVYRILRLIFAEYQQVLFVEFGEGHASAIPAPAIPAPDFRRNRPCRRNRRTPHGRPKGKGAPRIRPRRLAHGRPKSLMRLPAGVVGFVDFVGSSMAAAGGSLPRAPAPSTKGRNDPRTKGRASSANGPRGAILSSFRPAVLSSGWPGEGALSGRAANQRIQFST